MTSRADRVQWKGGDLVLNDPSLKGSLFFYAPLKGGALEVGTWHSQGLHQNIELWEGSSKITSIKISKVNTKYKLNIPSTSKTKSGLLELRIPKMDLYLRSSSISGYATKKLSAFPIHVLQWIPNHFQSRGVFPGSIQKMVVKLRNPEAKSQLVQVYLPSRMAGCALQLGSTQPARFSILANQEYWLQVRIHCSTSLKLGQEVKLSAKIIYQNYPNIPLFTTFHLRGVKPASTAKKRPFVFPLSSTISTSYTEDQNPKTNVGDLIL